MIKARYINHRGKVIERTFPSYQKLETFIKRKGFNIYFYEGWTYILLEGEHYETPNKKL